MSKEELKQGLINSGVWGKVDKNSFWWKKAFDEFNYATNSKLRPTCPMCFKKVKEWIEK